MDSSAPRAMKLLPVTLFFLLAGSVIAGPVDWLKAVGRSISHPPRRAASHRARAKTSQQPASPARKVDRQIASTSGVLRSDPIQPGDREERAPSAAAASPPAQRSIATPPPLTASETGDLPYGVPVSGKPGFVISPYSPNGGYVDVRDLPSGIQVKDPYTGKIFLTP